MEIREEGTIVFEIDKFESDTDFFNEVGQQLKILTNAGYECLFYYEDVGVYVLKYAYHNFEMGCPSFRLITSEESEDLLYSRSYKEDPAKQEIESE